MSFNVKYSAARHNSKNNTENTKDATIDTDEKTTHVAGKLVNVADTTRESERVQLGLLEDAICEE